MLELLPPVTNQTPHVGLGPLEFRYLPTEGVQLPFCEMKHTMARNAAVVPRAENLREFVQRETELQSPLCKLDALNGRGREYAIPPTCPLRCWKDAELLIVTQCIGTDASQACKLSRTQVIAIHQNSMNLGIGSRVKLCVSW